ncbi:nucleotide-binding alpha-beta plait domain-containing protein, partial [Tanacetum coccineum]
MFSRYGKVVDVYVAFKRTKKNTRFGFVRFINIWDIGSFERKLKEILIGDSNLIINAAIFFKDDRKAFSASDLLQGDKYLRSRLENCWVGKAKNFHVLQNAWDIIDNNGLSECKLWEDNGASYGWLSWLIIEGLPLLARNLGAVRSTLSSYGQAYCDGSNFGLGANDVASRPVATFEFTNNVPDLNVSLAHNGSRSHKDDELDELFFGLQRLSQKVNDNQSIGGNKRRSKPKKAKLMVSGDSGSPPLVSCNDVNGNDLDMKAIGEQIGFSFVTNEGNGLYT